MIRGEREEPYEKVEERLIWKEVYHNFLIYARSILIEK